MIVFDLRCSAEHVFEAWFASSAAYETQQARGLVHCPLCDSTSVIKAAMAPSIAAKGNRAAERAGADAEQQDRKALLAAIAAAQATVLAQSTWVGAAFTETARAMHHGDTPQAPIHGEATRADAEHLLAEGVRIAPLPLPVVPPPLCN